MKKHSPEALYRMLCSRLRQRIEAAERNLASNEALWQKVENVSLHGRKAIETIAHMCLAAIEHGVGELGIPQDAKHHYNAETIFKRLKKKQIDALPSPSRMSKSNDPRFKAVFSGTEEHRLCYDELIELYQLFHNAMHEPNPYKMPDAAAQYLSLLPRLSAAIGKIRNFSWVHFTAIKGRAFMVDLKNEYGRTVVSLAEKAGEMPEDLANYRAPTPKPLADSMSGVRIPDFPRPSTAPRTTP